MIDTDVGKTMQQKLKHGTVGEGQKQVELRTAIN
jgi:hypothetical protein